MWKELGRLIDGFPEKSPVLQSYLVFSIGWITLNESLSPG